MEQTAAVQEAKAVEVSKTFTGGLTLKATPSETENVVTVSLWVGGNEVWGPSDLKGTTTDQVDVSDPDNYTVKGKVSSKFSGDGKRGSVSVDLTWNIQGTSASYKGTAVSW